MRDADDDGDDLPRGRRRFSRAFWILLGSFVAVVLLVAGYLLYQNQTSCGGSVAKADDNQCVGIAEGAPDDVFGARYADVLRAIRVENAAIDASNRPAVDVAVLTSVPQPGEDEQLSVETRQELLGVYAAQRQANAAGSAGANRQFRLVVVNDGSLARHWAAKEVVPALVDRVTKPDAAHPLVAVIGAGESVQATREALGRLTRSGVPVITARLTADQVLDQPATPGQPLARVAPTNSDEAAAAANYLRPDTKRVLIIQNSDDDDTYSRSLGDAFRRAYPDPQHSIVEPTEFYSAAAGGVANTMGGVLLNVCQQRPDAVFFAGRAPALADLIAALPKRPCPDLKISIFTGDDGQLGTPLAPAVAAGLGANATVVRAALADPAAWTAAPQFFTAASFEELTGACSVCLHGMFPAEPLVGDAAVLGYDAMLTAVTAVRSPTGVNDTPQLVGQAFKRLHGLAAVPGASGWLSFAGTGEAIDKAVPLVALQPDGSVTFVRLASPRGAPCLPDGKSC
jgi:hypothetical protein